MPEPTALTPDQESKRREAFSRFRQLYRERIELDQRLEKASAWILDRYAPYRLGEIVTVPDRPPTLESGKAITVRSIKLDCDPRTGRVHWCVAGDGGFFRREIGSEMPAGRSGDQTELF